MCVYCAILVVEKGLIMAQSVNVNIRMDKNLKKQAEELFMEFGMNMTTAFTVFAKTVVRERKIPFEISARDDFYNEYNQERLIATIEQLNESDKKRVVKSLEDLKSMEDE